MTKRKTLDPYMGMHLRYALRNCGVCQKHTGNNNTLAVNNTLATTTHWQQNKTRPSIFAQIHTWIDRFHADNDSKNICIPGLRENLEERKNPWFHACLVVKTSKFTRSSMSLPPHCDYRRVGMYLQVRRKWKLPVTKSLNHQLRETVAVMDLTMLKYRQKSGGGGSFVKKV